jgi:hypothetical protein
MNGLLNLLKLVAGREIAFSITAGRNLDQFNYTRIPSRWESTASLLFLTLQKAKINPNGCFGSILKERSCYET